MDKTIENVAQDIFFIHKLFGLEVEGLKKDIIESLKEEDNVEFSKEDLDKLDEKILELFKQDK